MPSTVAVIKSDFDAPPHPDAWCRFTAKRQCYDIITVEGIPQGLVGARIVAVEEELVNLPTFGPANELEKQVTPRTLFTIYRVEDGALITLVAVMKPYVSLSVSRWNLTPDGGYFWNGVEKVLLKKGESFLIGKGLHELRLESFEAQWTCSIQLY